MQTKKLLLISSALLILIFTFSACMGGSSKKRSSLGNCPTGQVFDVNGTCVDAAAASDVDGFAPAVVGGAGVGAQAALFQPALDLFVVGAVAVGDADVLPELGFEGGVELVERGGGAAFELQGRP